MSNSSIEIYTLNLSRNYTFTSLVNSKWKTEDEPELDDNNAFTRLYTKLLDALIGQGIWESRKHTKKGLAVMPPLPAQPILDEPHSQNDMLKKHANSFIIEGYIDGGLYNIKRKMATYTQTEELQEIPRTKIVTDSYYFYLYLRMNSGKGILMMESKKGMYMSGVLTEFVSDMLSIHNVCRCISSMYVPEEIKQDFKNGAVLKSVTCSSNLVSSTRINNQEVQKRYKVTVKIEPENQPLFNNRDGIIGEIMQFAVKIGDRLTPFNNFGNKKGEMFNDDEHSTKTFFLDDPDVVPKIALSDEMYDEQNSILIREQIKEKCDELLQIVQREIYDIQRPRIDDENEN